ALPTALPTALPGALPGTGAVTPADAPTGAAPPGPVTVAAGSDWEVGGQFPAVAAADGALVLRRAEARWALADLAPGPAYTASVATTFASGAGFGILLGVARDAHGRIDGISVDVDPFEAGGGIVVRRWVGGHRHWRPLVVAPVPDPAALFGAHALDITVGPAAIVAVLDGTEVLRAPRPLAGGCDPLPGDRIGVHAWATTEVRVERLAVVAA
ncbi:MAG: hypothetical protein ACKOVH_05110, partial [Actinomycetota bacterium]